MICIKRVLILLMILLLLSACGKSIDATSSSPAEQLENHIEKQAKATTAYQSMYEHFQPIELNEGEFEYDYDSDYGGAYINDNDDLVICVKGLTQESKDKYILYCGTEEILFQEVNYSFLELCQYAAMIHPALGSNVLYGVNEQNNCVDVFISPGTDVPENLKDLPITFIETEEDFGF